MRKNLLVLILTILLLFTSLCSCESESVSNNSGHSETESNSLISDDISDEYSNFYESSVPSDSSISTESSESSENSNENNNSQPEIPEDTIINFLACPDNIIHPSVFYDAIERAARTNNVSPVYKDLHNAEYDFYQIYEHVADQIFQADIAYINQETLIGGTSSSIIGYPRFNSPSAVADTVIDIGFDIVNVAHNHMLDSNNTTYLDNCYNLFETAGLDVIGYYPDEASTENITVIEREGIKVAFLAYTYGTNGIRLPSDTEYVIPYLSETLIRKQVPLAKQVADIVIVSCHWGDEDTFNPKKSQKEYADLMCELGVDVVLGMHPHVIQPMEWLYSENGSKTLVVYSLGNFVSGMVAGKNMLAGMLSLDIRKNAQTGEITIESPLFIPIVTHYVKKSRVASNDTGYRDFKIYYLNEYTEELASEHGVCRYEKSHSTTLVGGGFSKANLVATLKKYIPAEFLPEEFQQ